MSSISKVQISGTNYSVTGKTFYGTCSTAAGTTAKVVACSDFTSDDLIAGAMILVKNTTANTGAVANLTMNVNSTGAKSIKKIYNGTVSNLTAAGEFGASSLLFVYDGTYWVSVNLDYNNTYSAASFTSTYDSRYKSIQTAVSDPSASGNATSFIDTISQNTQGVISVTKKTIPTASSSTAGITKIGASGGAAAYSHTHDYSKVSFTQTNTSGDEIGKITIDGTTTTLYADANTDTKVLQSATTADDNKYILLKGSASGADSSDKVYYTTRVTANPSTGLLIATGLSATTLNGVTIGSSPKFTDTTYTFTANNPTLAWGATATLGTIGGTEFKVTMPANPNTNTDTLVAQAVSSANYNYPLLASAVTTGITTNQTTTAIRNNSIYINPSTGNLQVTKLNGVAVGSAPKFTDTTYTFNKTTVATGVAANGTTAALTSVTASTITMYGTGTTTVYGTSATTVYGSGTQANVMAAPTVVDGVLSWTLVTTSNGTAVTVSNGTSRTVANGTSATVANGNLTTGTSTVLTGVKVSGTTDAVTTVS